MTMIGGRSASAAGLSSTELDLLKFAQRIELSLHDLYDEALQVDKGSAAWTIMADSHESFAQAIAGFAGLSANERNEDVFGSYRAAMRGADRAMTAYELESIAAATHSSCSANYRTPALLKSLPQSPQQNHATVSC